MSINQHLTINIKIKEMKYTSISLKKKTQTLDCYIRTVLTTNNNMVITP